MVVGTFVVLSGGSAQAATPWSGSITSFTADTLTTDVNHDYAIVSVEVSEPVRDGYLISVYDDSGTRVCQSMTSYPTGCAFTSRPATNSSKSYTAYVALDAPTSGPPTDDVRATTGPLTITNIGWTGHFTSVDVVEGDEAFLGATSAVFTWDEPLEFVHIDIVDSAGDVITTCSTAGILDCAGARALGPEETEAIHAEARVTLPNGGYATVATSADAELTGMDPYAYADFLLSAPEASVAALLGATRAAQAVELRTAVQSETFCVALGRVLPSTTMFHSSAPDATVMCVAGQGLVLGFLIGSAGVEEALLIMSMAAGADHPATEPDPDPAPVPDPGGDGGQNQPPDEPPPGDYLCEVIGPNGEKLALAPQEFYSHVIGDHMSGTLSTGSQWDQSIFGDNLDVLKDFICRALEREPDASPENPDTSNTLRQYTNPSNDIGTTESGETSQFTIVVRPNGTVASAYPGT